MTKDCSLICRRRMGIQLACSFIRSFLCVSILSRSILAHPFFLSKGMYYVRRNRCMRQNTGSRHWFFAAPLPLHSNIQYKCEFSRVHTYLALTVASSFAVVVVAMASSFLRLQASNENDDSWTEPVAHGTRLAPNFVRQPMCCFSGDLNSLWYCTVLYGNRMRNMYYTYKYIPYRTICCDGASIATRP